MIDGYPIDGDQADSFVADIGSPSVVICLDITDEVAMKRLTSRGNFDDQQSSIEKSSQSEENIFFYLLSPTKNLPTSCSP